LRAERRVRHGLSLASGIRDPGPPLSSSHTPCPPPGQRSESHHRNRP
jgi:hypothetical protein